MGDYEEFEQCTANFVGSDSWEKNENLKPSYGELSDIPFMSEEGSEKSIEGIELGKSKYDHLEERKMGDNQEFMLVADSSFSLPNYSRAILPTYPPAFLPEQLENIICSHPQKLPSDSLKDSNTIRQFGSYANSLEETKATSDCLKGLPKNENITQCLQKCLDIYTEEEQRKGGKKRKLLDKKCKNGQLAQRAAAKSKRQLHTLSFANKFYAMADMLLTQKNKLKKAQDPSILLPSYGDVHNLYRDMKYKHHIDICEREQISFLTNLLRKIWNKSEETIKKSAFVNFANIFNDMYLNRYQSTTCLEQYPIYQNTFKQFIDDINNNKLENFGELDPDLSKIIKEIAYTPQVKNNEGLMPDELLGYIKDYPKFTMELHETITKAKKALLGKKFDFDEIKKEYLEKILHPDFMEEIILNNNLIGKTQTNLKKGHIPKLKISKAIRKCAQSNIRINIKNAKLQKDNSKKNENERDEDDDDNQKRGGKHTDQNSQSKCRANRTNFNSSSGSSSGSNNRAKYKTNTDKNIKNDSWVICESIMFEIISACTPKFQEKVEVEVNFRPSNMELEEENKQITRKTPIRNIIKTNEVIINPFGFQNEEITPDAVLEITETEQIFPNRKYTLQAASTASTEEIIFWEKNLSIEGNFRGTGEYSIIFDLKKGKMAGTRENGEIDIINIILREIEFTLYGHTRSIVTIYSIPIPNYDKHIIASGSYDKTIRVWDLESRECLTVLDWKNNLEAFNQLQIYEYLKEHQKSAIEEIDFIIPEVQAPLIFNFTSRKFILSDILGNVYFDKEINTLYPFRECSSSYKLEMFSSVLVEEYIFICGGKRKLRLQPQKCSLSNKAYKIKCHPSAINTRNYQESVESLMDMLSAKIHHGIVASSTQVYIIGGATVADQEQIMSKSCEMYDWETGFWGRIPDLNSPKTQMGCCIFKGIYIYIYSGRQLGGFPVDEIEKLNITRQNARWQIIKGKQFKQLVPQMQAIPLPNSRNKILLFGGISSFRTYTYDVDSRRLEIRRGNIKDSIREKMLRVVDERIYIPSFSTVETTRLCIYNIRFDQWEIPIINEEKILLSKTKTESMQNLAVDSSEQSIANPRSIYMADFQQYPDIIHRIRCEERFMQIGIMSRICYGEIRESSYWGKQGVCHVLNNRARIRHTTIEIEALRDNQFQIWEADTNMMQTNQDQYWQECKWAAQEVLEGEDDNTNGATHFSQTHGKQPRWIPQAILTVLIGNIQFYKGIHPYI